VFPSTADSPTGTASGRTATTLQFAATVVAATFLVVGVLGFIPGITTHYGDLTFAGHDSDAKLLGIFEVSVLHNVVHLLFGVVGLYLARSWEGARGFLIGGGVIYFLLFVYGLVIDHESGANFVPLNDADNWLHFVLSILMVGLGVLLGRSLGRPGEPEPTTGR
jgi:hypothetical protein